MPLPKEDIDEIRRERIERARHPSEPYSIDAFFDPFHDLTDEFMAEALPPFVDAAERMEALLDGGGELFAGEIGAQSTRLWSEIEAVQEAVIAICDRYCHLRPGQVVCERLRRMIRIATPRLRTLIADINVYTPRLNAFLDNLPPRSPGTLLSSALRRRSPDMRIVTRPSPSAFVGEFAKSAGGPNAGRSAWSSEAGRGDSSTRSATGRRRACCACAPKIWRATA
jgi:hypothetical protein